MQAVRAISSLPVPVSPVMSTGMSDGAIFIRSRQMSCSAGDRHTNASPPSIGITRSASTSLLCTASAAMPAAWPRAKRSRSEQAGVVW